MREKEA
jgi:hypothetical protein